MLHYLGLNIPYYSCYTDTERRKEFVYIMNMQTNGIVQDVHVRHKKLEAQGDN